MINTATQQVIECPDWCISTSPHVDHSDHIGQVMKLPALGQTDTLWLIPSMTEHGDPVILVSLDGGDSDTPFTTGQARAFIAALQSQVERVAS